VKSRTTSEIIFGGMTKELTAPPIVPLGEGFAGDAMDRDELEKHLQLEHQICFALYGAAHAFTRAYKPLLDPLGLTYPQYIAMMALWERETATVKALGEMLGLDSGTLSPLLKRLEQAGLISRKRSLEDERQDLKKDAVGVMQAIGQATGCGFDELAAIRDTLKNLSARLNDTQN
jgi:DNA-binding transcriptional ArsR family regulator